MRNSALTLIEFVIILFFCFDKKANEIDIIDEALAYFKANIFFKNFEIKVNHLEFLVKSFYQVN